MSAEFTIVVNSTDGYEDCWQPFFQLFAEYWPNCKHPIVLNTETKDFSYPGLDIRCSKTGAAFSQGRSPWGQCMLKCLENVDTDIFLYLQEDFFLKAPVESDTIDEFVAYMLRRKVTCIGLTHFSSSGPFHVTEHPLLWDVDQHARYRLSLQAGLWNRHLMRKHIVARESPWEFELKGSIRAGHIYDSILTVNRQVFNPTGRMVFGYDGGIIGGKWNRDAVEVLFREKGISTDFSRRGFYAPPDPSSEQTGPRISIKQGLKTIINTIEDACGRLRYH